MRRAVVTIVVVTGGEQRGIGGISDAVKREITQGLVEGHGADKGIAVADKSVFYDFETCEGIELQYKHVCCIAC